MRVSRQQLAFTLSVLFPGNYFTALQSNRGAGSARWRVALPAPCRGSMSSRWFSSGWVAVVPHCQARCCPPALPLLGRGSAAGTWGTQLVAQSRQVQLGFADGTAPAQQVVGLIQRHGDGCPSSRTVPVLDGAGPCSAPVGAFAFLPGDTLILFTLRSPRCPCRDGDGCWVLGQVCPSQPVALGHRHPPSQPQGMGN